MNVFIAHWDTGRLSCDVLQITKSLPLMLCSKLYYCRKQLQKDTRSFKNYVLGKKVQITSFSYLISASCLHNSQQFESVPSYLPYYNSRTVKHKKHENCDCEDERQVAIFLLLLDSISCCL